MVRHFLFFLCLIGSLASRSHAQDQLAGSLITSENASDLALSYISLATNFHALQTRPLMLQEFVLPDEAERSYNEASYRVSILNLETGEVEATLETRLGLVDAHENYMLTANRTGFKIWNLHTYQEVYQLAVDERMVAGPGYRDTRYLTSPFSQYLGYYSLFAVQDTRAVVGNKTLFHVIDLETGEEVERYYNSCELLEWLYTMIGATCKDGSVVSPLQIEFEFESDQPKIPSLLYPANNLRIDLTYNGVTALTTLDQGVSVGLPIQDVTDMELGSMGRVLIMMRRNNGYYGFRTIRIFDVFACRIPGENTANVRAEASTQSASLGHLNILYEGNRVGVIAQKQQSDGVWWQLAPGGWVRDDVAKKEGDCTSVATKDE